MNVEFNENRSDLNYYQNSGQKKGLANLLIKWGLAKDETGAQKIMIIIAVVCFALSIYFFIKI